MAKAKSIKNPQKAKSPSHTPLKIVQAVHAFPPAIGGLETHVYNLSLEIAKQGHKVIIHTSNQKDSKEIDEQLKQKGIIVKRHFAIQFPIFSSVKLIPTMCLSLLREKADIYHSHGYGAIVPIQTSIISFIKRKKFIWAIHGIPKFRGIKSIFPKLYSIPALLPLKIANKIICVSDSAKEQLPKFAQNKSEIIPNGLSEIFFTNSPEHKKHGCAHEHFKILFVGRLDKSKGIVSEVV